MYDNFVLSKVFVGIHIAKRLAKHPLSDKGSIYLIVALKLGEIIGSCKYRFVQGCFPALRDGLVPLLHMAICDAPPSSSDLFEQLDSIPASAYVFQSFTV